MLRIKDWHKFQHYKTGRGAPPWIKLYRDLLNSRDWFLLEPEAAKFLISAWLIAAENDGALPAIDALAFRLRLASKDVTRLLSLCKDWIITDDSTMLAERYQDATPETETETETDKRESKRQIARGSRLPPDWKPEGAFDQGELDRFRDYWIAKAGKDGIKLDWQATWRNWCRNSSQWKRTAHLDKPPETYRVGHAKGIFKREPEAPELTPEEKAERARRVDEILRGARRPVEGLGEVGG